MSRSVPLRGVVAGLLLAALSVPAWSQDAPAKVGPAPADPSTVLLKSSKVTLTRGDYDTDLLKLPESARGGFGANIDRINTALRAILVDKTLAQEARDDGLDRDPEIQRKIAAETNRILAAAVIDREREGWEKAFDARPNLEQAARERWLAQPDKYRRPDEVTFTQIKYGFASSTPEQAREKAADARRRIVAGADASAIAAAESNDPDAARTRGKVDWTSVRAIGEGRLANGIANLRNVGDVSRPLEGDDGFYVVRLDGKRPGPPRDFDNVKKSIIADMRKEYVSTMLTQKLAAIRNDPTIVVNQPAVDALVVRIDPSFTTMPPGVAPAPPTAPK